MEEGKPVVDESVVIGPRINVRGNETALNAPWRFYVEGNRHVSC